MFGYIKIYQPEMKFKDYETYRGIYCSLCRDMGKKFGPVARLTLNYDFTFLLLVKLSLSGETPCFEKKRCPVFPVKKCNNCKNAGTEFDFVSNVALLMVYYKLYDNISDEKRLKKFTSKFLMRLFQKKYERAKAALPEAEALMKTMTERQRDVEAQPEVSIDLAAHYSADALGQIFSLGEPGGEKSRKLYRLGYCLGRYVYFMDAYDDFDADQKNGAFNPFLTGACVDRACAVIHQSAGEALAAFHALEVERYGEIIENILSFGLPANLDRITAKRKEV